MKEKRRLLIKCIAVPLITGAAAGFITRNSMALFRQLKKPPLSPPGWIFPIAWTILYVLMGTASYLIVTSARTGQRARALAAYAAQLAANFLWPIFFFKCKWYLFAFLWLTALWLLAAAAAKSFYAISKKAGLLLIPYLAWLTYAAYLNLFIALLN